MRTCSAEFVVCAGNFQFANTVLLGFRARKTVIWTLNRGTKSKTLRVYHAFGMSLLDLAASLLPISHWGSEIKFPAAPAAKI
jgi:hypothetical protein